MDEQPLIPHVEINIDGIDYKATYFVEEGILYVVINGKPYSCAVTSDNPEPMVKAMMIEEALKNSLRSPR